MTREQFFAKIEPYRDALTRKGVRRIGVFGSVARDEARDDSDVAVLVELCDGVDLVDFVTLQEYLEEIVGTKVDLCSAGGLRNPRMRARVLRDVRYAA